MGRTPLPNFSGSTPPRGGGGENVDKLTGTNKNVPIGNRSVEINKYKFNHYSVPSDHVRLQTNNINLLLRLTNELGTIFFLQLVLVIKMIKK